MYLPCVRYVCGVYGCVGFFFVCLIPIFQSRINQGDTESFRHQFQCVDIRRYSIRPTNQQFTDNSNQQFKSAIQSSFKNNSKTIQTAHFNMVFYIENFDFSTGEYHLGDGVYIDLTDMEIDSLEEMGEYDFTINTAPIPAPRKFEYFDKKGRTTELERVCSPKFVDEEDDNYEVPQEKIYIKIRVKKEKSFRGPFNQVMDELLERRRFFDFMDRQARFTAALDAEHARLAAEAEEDEDGWDFCDVCDDHFPSTDGVIQCDCNQPPPPPPYEEFISGL